MCMNYSILTFKGSTRTYLRSRAHHEIFQLLLQPYVDRLGGRTADTAISGSPLLLGCIASAENMGMSIQMKFVS